MRLSAIILSHNSKSTTSVLATLVEVLQKLTDIHGELGQCRSHHCTPWTFIYNTAALLLMLGVWWNPIWSGGRRHFQFKLNTHQNKTNKNILVLTQEPNVLVSFAWFSGNQFIATFAIFTHCFKLQTLSMRHSRQPSSTSTCSSTLWNWFYTQDTTL